MARYDHSDPKMGTYRATLAAATVPTDVERLLGVGHDANGRLVVGAGQTGITAVWVATKVHRVGKRVDPMTNGQIIEFGPSAGTPGTDFGLPGAVYYSNAAGAILQAPGGVVPAGGTRIGHTVDDGSRLIVRVVAGAVA